MSRVRRPPAMSYDDDYDYDDDMVAAPTRRHGGPRDDDDDAPGRPGLALRIVALALKHPVPAFGGAGALALTTAIAFNAMTHQPGHHPAPLFETRPFADAAATATVPQPRLKPNAAETAGEAPTQTGTAQPRLKPAVAEANPVVKELQALMTARGLYRGPVDGAAGPGTADAIRALEKSLGLVQTGEANERLLALARERAATPMPTPMPASPPPTAVAAAPAAVAVPYAPPPARVPPTKPAAMAKEQHAVPVTRPAGQRAVPLVPQPGSVATAPQPENRLARVQKALAAAGFGPLRNDGVLDDPTVDAIRRYEVHRGWEPTGRLSDRLTLDLLMKSANR